MTEALERLLPRCGGKPDKVAARLDAQHREGDVLLLGGGIAIPPASNPSMLGIVAHSPPAGPPFLYVQMRAGRPPGPIWNVGMTLEDLDKHHQFWTFERKSFEDHFPADQPPAQEVSQERPAGVSVKAWVTDKAQQLKRNGRIPTGILKTAFARMLAGDSADYKYINKRLKEWGLWPITAIKT
jgi:hypothetical protein